MPDAQDLSNGSVGLIANQGAAGRRVRRILREADCSLTFDTHPDGIDDLPATAVIVLVQPEFDVRGSFLAELRDLFPEGRLVVCTERPESLTVRQILDLGVDGLLWLPELDGALEPTLRAVHAGQVAFPRDLAQRERNVELTNREKQTLSMVIMGMTNLEIAQKLFISESTVKSHLNTAYKKLGVHSRAEAQQLITDPDKGLGTGILAITAPGLARGRPPRQTGGEG